MATNKKKPIKIKSDGSFEAKGKTVEEALAEIDLDDINDRAHLGVSFDTHYVTAQCIAYGKILTGIPLYDYQEEMAYSIIHSVISFNNDVLTILLSRQSGKSEALAFVVNTLSTILPALATVIPDLDQFKNGIRIGLFAPQSDQVWNTYNRALSRLTTDNAEQIMGDPDLEVSLIKSTKYELTNGSSLVGQVASKQSKIESATYDLVIVEEAQDVDSYIMEKSIEPMVSACVCAGTLLWDDQGNLVPVELIELGDRVVGYDGTESSIDEVTYLTAPTEKKCFRITTNTGRTLDCSYDHPILYRERKGGMYGRKMFFQETKDLRVGNQIAVIESVNIWGNLKMWEPRLIGWLIGDGSYGNDHSPKLSTCDEELYSYIKDNFDWSYSRVPRTTNLGKEYQEINIKGICHQLRKIGIYKQVKKDKRLPKYVNKYTKSDCAELLGGFYDTDGYCSVINNRRGKIGLTSYVYPLLEQVKFVLQKFGIHANIYTKKATKSSFGTEDYYDLIISDKRSIITFYKEIIFHIKYKQANLINLVNILETHNCKIPKEVQGIRFERIEKIEKLGNKLVYNMTVANTHTYVANGIVTHNTGGTIIKCGTTGTHKNHYWYEIQHNKNKNRSQKDLRLLYHYEYDYKKIFAAKRKQFAIDGKRFHLNWEKDVTKKLERWGRDSQAFRLSYALEWDLESGMLVSDKEFDKLLNKKKGLKVDQDDLIIAGLDIGKDIASTVLTLGKIVWEPNDEDKPPKIEICGWLKLSGIDYEIQHQMIVEYLFENNVQNLYADYTGVGKAVVDRLIYSVGDSVNVTPFNFSKQSKSEMWYNLIDVIQQGRLVIPANRNTVITEEYQNFEEQMKNCLKYYDGAYLVCHKAEGYLDDFVDSLGLMCMATDFEATDEIEEEEFNPMFENILNNRNLRTDGGWDNDNNKSQLR